LVEHSGGANCVKSVATLKQVAEGDGAVIILLRKEGRGRSGSLLHNRRGRHLLRGEGVHEFYPGVKGKLLPERPKSTFEREGGGGKCRRMEPFPKNTKKGGSAPNALGKKGEKTNPFTTKGRRDFTFRKKKKGKRTPT